MNDNEQEILLNRQMEAINNALVTRSNFLRSMMDARRDLNDECGYKQTADLDASLYKEFYDRNPIATRVVQVLPKESWQVLPKIVEDPDAEEETEFEKAWNELNLSLRKSKLKGSSVIWEYLQRADILSGIGAFGIILLGLSDGENSLSQPVEASESLQLNFIRVFDESLVKVSSYESDKTSERFGQPILYSIELFDPSDADNSKHSVPNETLEVHYTRVVHIADVSDPTSSEIFAVPRMRAVIDNLQDLKKLYSGSAEMYWKGAFPGLSFETHPQLGADEEFDTDALKSMAENYFNGLQRYMANAGMTVKSIAPQVVDPSPQIEKQLEAVAIKTGIPKRKLMGTERGELASSQDDGDWNDMLRARQENYITPHLIAKFIDRLIELRILPEPTEYQVVWPDLDREDEDKNSQVVQRITTALSAYITSGLDALIQPVDFLVHIVGIEDDIASSIVDNTFEELKKEMVQEEQVQQPPNDDEQEEETVTNSFSDVDWILS